ncbi:Protein ABC1 like protein, mitochondrial [Alteripontixanthobacter maritimus]|uniref:Protein ABC1 like protein, mitochondrial n=1 Tax=Alteripontixanthobacter maritimus TaxID=2161824 RepID=A0A369QBQ0_9SPHN|nr:AarF/ABC1/UbiB kinase family protein [Alteripontixanthobacter maritimus]RDC59678.1 Protein ABC1 like protein, mitochondrial [Alteripontixanthobacter maritimus]
MDDGNNKRGRAVPSGRLARFGGFARLAGGVAQGMAAEGARRLASGERPRLEDMLLTPGNARRLADRLGHMRGAAMKLGQMISMDAGDFLPAELSGILATLRDNADFMPPKQLDRVLAVEWGEGWRKQFKLFNARPMAAASIGQVHKAETRDGRTLAIKVQYPGVAESIDSDVDNVAGLLRVSKMLPEELDIAPLLAAAKAQLHEEADYRREGEQMQLYAGLLENEPAFVVPELAEDLTRDKVLAMSFEPGVPIETLETESQEQRDRMFARLIRLVARELLEFGVMQTDPNFANYRFRRGVDGVDDKIVLLDFGAARAVAPDVQAAYRRMIDAGLSEDRQRVREEALATGFLGLAAVDRHPERVDRLIDIVVTEMSHEGPFDFGDRAFVPELRETSMPIARDREAWHLPPAETLFVQRKISGTALLGARLGARVDVRAILQEMLRPTD